MKNLLNLGQKDIPAILFLIYIAKILILGATLVDAAILAPIVALLGFKLYLDHNTKQNPSEEVISELEVTKQRMTALENKLSNINLMFTKPKQTEIGNEFKWGR